MNDINEDFQELMDFFNGKTPRGAFSIALQEVVSRVKASLELRREYMTLQIFMDDARREERKIGREEGLKEGHEEGLKEGADRYLIGQICKKLARNLSAEEIADNLEEDIEDVKRIVEVAKAFAPQYDIDQIYEKLY